MGVNYHRELCEEYGIDTEAEELILVELMTQATLNPEYGSSILSQLKERDFGRPNNRCIFLALQSVYTSGLKVEPRDIYVETAYFWKLKFRPNISNDESLAHMAKYIWDIVKSYRVVDYVTFNSRIDEIGIIEAIREPLIEIEGCISRIKHMARHRYILQQSHNIVDASMQNKPIGPYIKNLAKHTGIPSGQKSQKRQKTEVYI